jgi:hypothetical protein
MEGVGSREIFYPKGGVAMNYKGIIVLSLCVILLIPALAMAGAVEGTIQGFHCVTQGKVCPVGKEDPLAAVEKTFVLHVRDKDFYFVPNIDRAVLSRYINKMIKIEGVIHTFSKESKSVKANDMYAKENGKWRHVWSKNKEDEIYYEIMGGGTPLGGN